MKSLQYFLIIYQQNFRNENETQNDLMENQLLTIDEAMRLAESQNYETEDYKYFKVIKLYIE